MPKVFIDGQEGTTGLRIYERFIDRDDIELITISEELRKDPIEKARCINSSDITFLCLPDAAAIDSVSLVTNPNVKIIDASTAHRTDPSWAYGFPELDQKLYEKIKNSKRVAVPGCYASGFNSIVYPLIKLGILPLDYPVACNAVSGYSGAGKKAIKVYESVDREKEYDAPRLYAMSQMHKHLKEMKEISGLKEMPNFNPFVCDYYNGMIVNISLLSSHLQKNYSAKEIYENLKKYYNDSEFVRVMPFEENGTTTGFLSANKLAGKDYMEIYVSGNNDRICITSLLDNLGKGASGAAIECMNIMMGIDPKTGLSL